MGNLFDYHSNTAPRPVSGPVAGVSERRQAMPEVAAFVDLCRTAYGGRFVDVDAAMATAQQASREHAQVLAEQGEAAAARWLVRNAHRCTFFAREAGRTVGLACPFGRNTVTDHPTPPVTGPSRPMPDTGNSNHAKTLAGLLEKSPALSPKAGG